MFIPISYNLKKISSKLSLSSLKNRYGLSFMDGTNPDYVEAVGNSIEKLPDRLVRDCKISSLGFQDLGVSKEYYPNHGYYTPDAVLILNYRILDDKNDIKDSDGRKMSKLDQVLYHELGHGWDDAKGGGIELSKQPEWLCLSDWSETPKPGHKQVIIRDINSPELRGEWYYGPRAEFVRFYGKRNPWDDWADTFAYYVAGLKGLIPDDKINYFDNKLSPYYS